MAWTPIGVRPPHGVSSFCARQASGFSSSAFGKVIVASKCSTVPSSPGLNLLPQRRHLGMEAPVVAEPERDAGLLRRRHGGFGVGLRQREGFLAEHVLAGLRRGDRLRRMQRVRRREHHRIDGRDPRAAPRTSRRGGVSAPRRTPSPRATPSASCPRQTGSARCRPPLRPACVPTTPCPPSPL